MPARLAALRQVAQAGYPVGITVAPIMAVPGWETEYEALMQGVAEALDGVQDADLTAELITHRFTPKSKDVLQGWYPGSALEMDESQRARKTTKFGSVKWVLPRERMGEMRAVVERAAARWLPSAKVLYWT